VAAIALKTGEKGHEIKENTLSSKNICRKIWWNEK